MTPHSRLVKELFELIGYFLTSARGLIDEPRMYGPFRLIEGVSRICNFLEEEESPYQAFCTRLREKIDMEKFSVMNNEEAFIKLLDEVVLDYARQLKKEG